MKAFELEYDDDFKDCLIDSDDAKGEARRARSDQSLSNGIEAQIAVTSAPDGFWKEVLEWGRLRRKLSEREVQAIGICASYPRKVPTDFQCKQAVAALDRLRGDGFVSAP